MNFNIILECQSRSYFKKETIDIHNNCLKSILIDFTYLISYFYLIELFSFKLVSIDRICFFSLGRFFLNFFIKKIFFLYLFW